MKRLDEVLGSARPETGDSELEIPGGDVEPRDDEEACPRCGGAGFVRKAVPLGHPEFGRAFACECVLDEREEERLARLRRYSNLGPLTRLTFANLISRGRSSNPRDQERFKACVEDARAFAASSEGWLVLSGPSGCGKTHLAAAIAGDVIERGRTVLFTVVPDLLDHLRAAYRPDSDVAYDELFEQVRNAPLLVLDDLGTQSATPWAQEKLFQLINHRFNAQLPTVITTNVAFDRLDERLRTRLTDPALARVYSLEEGRDVDFRDLNMLDRPMIRKMTFESFDTGQDERLEAAYHMALAYAENPERWIVFSGEEHGCGKTHLAAAIANYRQQMGDRPFFVSVAELLAYLRKAMEDEKSPTYRRTLETVQTAPLLILDDLDVRARTPWVRETLFQVIDFRYTNVLPTVFTTNLNRSLLALRDKNASDDVAQRLATRLWDPTLCAEVEIQAPSYRVSLPRPSPEGRQGGRGRGGMPAGDVRRRGRGAAAERPSRAGPYE